MAIPIAMTILAEPGNREPRKIANEEIAATLRMPIVTFCRRMNLAERLAMKA